MTNDEKILQPAWHALEVEKVFRDLQVHENGLTVREASQRLHRYGPNQLQEAPRPSFWITLWDQLNNFVVILLIVSSLISALLGEWIDALAILSIVILNTVLGIVQERLRRAGAGGIEKIDRAEAHVLRNGHRQLLPARELVPGDMVFLEAGNYVPADVRLLEAVNLRVEEASLTGESLSVEKNAALVLNQNVPLGDRKNTAFMGTLVSYGRGRGVVVGTGMHTQLGLIASMLQNVEAEETPLQKRLDQLGKDSQHRRIDFGRGGFHSRTDGCYRYFFLFLRPAGLSSNVRQRNHECLYHRGQPGDCGGAGRIARGCDDQSRAGNA